MKEDPNKTNVVPLPNLEERRKKIKLKEEYESNRGLAFRRARAELIRFFSTPHSKEITNREVAEKKVNELLEKPLLELIELVSTSTEDDWKNDPDRFLALAIVFNTFS